MKIAFISDIHGNYDALKAVINDIRKLKIKKIFCLGDSINYYYESNKCLDLILKCKVECILGNHERIYFLCIKNKNIRQKYVKLFGQSINLNRKRLKAKHIKYLKSLPIKKKFTINKKKFLLAHGAPWNNNYYCYPKTRGEWLKKYTKYKINFFFIGHTHIPMKIKLGKNKLIINPGSVGQPRNGSLNAHWASFNTKTMKVELKSTKYNKQRLVKQIKLYDKNKKNLIKFFIKKK